MMRAALAVPEMSSSLDQNFQKMLVYIDEAVRRKADLILFPEAVISGLIICDEYAKDRSVAIELSSDYVLQLKAKANIGKIWISFGFLELDGNTIYDSALLINHTGEIVLHYRRMSSGWLAKSADSREYGCGEVYQTAFTPWGKAGILICGDLFETAYPFAAEAKINLLLFPFARCFSPEIQNPQRYWDAVEWSAYAQQISNVNASLTLMANYVAPAGLNGGGFGGAFVADGNGQLLTALSLNREGLLIWDSEKL